MCGNSIESREGCHSEAELPAGTAWRSSDDRTIEMPSNAFGEFRFSNTSKNTAKYVRVGFATDGAEEQKRAVVEQMRELLLGVWKLPHPNLIISVTGGADKFEVSNTQQKRFKRGIVRTAIKTGTPLDSRSEFPHPTSNLPFCQYLHIAESTLRSIV